MDLGVCVFGQIPGADMADRECANLATACLRALHNMLTICRQKPPFRANVVSRVFDQV